jgi:hypothetical protein
VTNNSESAKDIRVKKVEISLVANTMNTFCWGLCYPPTTYVSPETVTIDAHATNSTDFIGEYSPTGFSGASTVRYVFYDDANPSDSVCFNVEYSAFPLAINELGVAGIASAYPNPANSTLNVVYKSNIANAVLAIRNVLGTTVLEMPLTGTAGKVAVNVSGLKEGIYFYSLMENGQSLVTRKVVIRH